MHWRFRSFGDLFFNGHTESKSIRLEEACSPLPRGRLTRVAALELPRSAEIVASNSRETVYVWVSKVVSTEGKQRRPRPSRVSAMFVYNCRYRSFFSLVVRTPLSIFIPTFSFSLVPPSLRCFTSTNPAATAAPTICTTVAQAMPQI